MSSNNHVELLKDIRVGRLLCVDFGDKRVGTAISDPSQFLASDLETIQNKGLDKLSIEILDLCKENQAVALIIGLPLHMNGSVGEKAEKVQELAEKIKEHSDLPIVLWDERMSTISAEKALLDVGKSPSKNRHKIDQIAAVFILQSLLDRLSVLRKN